MSFRDKLYNCSITETHDNIFSNQESKVVQGGIQIHITLGIQSNAMILGHNDLIVQM